MNDYDFKIKHLNNSDFEVVKQTRIEDTEFYKELLKEFNEFYNNKDNNK